MAPYFQDHELNLYVERELIPGLADDCIAEFFERFGLLLDASPQSLEQVDGIIAAARLDPDAMYGPVGAYLGKVFCGSDGARWSPSFDRASGADGYMASRLLLYNVELDVFDLARQALQGSCRLAESFSQLHRPAPSARSKANI